MGCIKIACKFITNTLCAGQALNIVIILCFAGL